MRKKPRMVLNGFTAGEVLFILMVRQAIRSRDHRYILRGEVLDRLSEDVGVGSMVVDAVRARYGKIVKKYPCVKR